MIILGDYPGVMMFLSDDDDDYDDDADGDDDYDECDDNDETARFYHLLR